PNRAGLRVRVACKRQHERNRKRCEDSAWNHDVPPGSPVGKSCHGDGGRAIEGIGCAEHARHYRKWHATHWPGCTSRNAGDSTRQRSTAYGQRVWKWQPEGGLIGLGTSPCSTRFSRLIFGSGTGTASSSDSV